MVRHVHGSSADVMENEGVTAGDRWTHLSITSIVFVHSCIAYKWRRGSRAVWKEEDAIHWPHRAADALYGRGSHMHVILCHQSLVPTLFVWQQMFSVA